jgi:hypothetical protein
MGAEWIPQLNKGGSKCNYITEKRNTWSGRLLENVYLEARREVNIQIELSETNCDNGLERDFQ